MKIISTSLLLALTTTPVLSADILQVIRVSTSGQIGQVSPIEVRLANGYGVTINFLGSGQKITKAWLNNPAFVALDTDGCLVGLTKTCANPGASVLHLKRISDLPITGLPKTNFSLLTLITQSSKGSGVYVFRINKANTPGALVYEVISTPESSMALAIEETQLRGIIFQGIKQELTKKTEHSDNLRQFKDALLKGDEILVALKKAALDLETLTRLIQLGKEQKNESSS